MGAKKKKRTPTVPGLVIEAAVGTRIEVGQAGVFSVAQRVDSGHWCEWDGMKHLMRPGRRLNLVPGRVHVTAEQKPGARIRLRFVAPPDVRIAKVVRPTAEPAEAT